MTDDELISLLGEALRQVEPRPDLIDEAARAAFGWHGIEAELAELTFDSLADAAGVRGDDSNRQVTFQSPALEIEVMFTGDGGSRLIGQLVPPRASRIELICGPERHEATADGGGRFGFDLALSGPTRLIVHSEGATPVHTDWIVL